MQTEENPSENRGPRVHIIRHLFSIFATAAVIATLFNSFTPLGLTFNLGGGIEDIFSPPSAQEINQFFPTPTNRPRPKIGIVAGHWGRTDDVGAVCPDGLTELEINLEIATLVQQELKEEGFDVDLLKENDERLEGYRALALVSVHADSCVFYNLEATGFKVAAALATARPDKANRLVSCVYSRYSEITKLPYHASVTDDMSNYHAFGEIHSDTAAVIIETGFLNLDRQILTQQPGLIADGIAKGVLCYIRNEDASPPNEGLP
jgi:N-acetylmuramoyl-L-alanine amidase